jgi:hypothetical protein
LRFVDVLAVERGQKNKTAEAVSTLVSLGKGTPFPDYQDYH